MRKPSLGLSIVSVWLACSFFLVGCDLGNILRVKYFEPVDFRNLKRSSGPNDALACPSDYCDVPVDVATVWYSRDVEEVFSEVVKVLSKQDRTEILKIDRDRHQAIAVQSTRWLRFPDTVWVEVAELGGSSSLLIYSRSNYGYWDLGVNLARIKALVRVVENALPENSRVPQGSSKS
ncbi:MAG: DUF1499 domain-containing protein [Rhodospirillaceae bacterium]|jgi:uncharacterized protein (DUF1499 family)